MLKSKTRSMNLPIMLSMTFDYFRNAEDITKRATNITAKLNHGGATPEGSG